MIRINNGCKGCKDRTPDCHSNCERYEVFLKKIADIKRKQKIYQDRNRTDSAYTRGSIVEKAARRKK